ncbi:CCA tRNA nucleotidyltransferase [candidate division KSB1 bacterium]
MKKSANKILEKLREAGFKAYFAGGCVRDMVMGKIPKDYDIASSAKPEEVKKLFKRTIDIGAKFGVTIIPFNKNQIEVATFRADGPYLDGRRPSKVIYTDEKEDVLRRDFTINGLLYDPVNDKIIDYVNGVKDIKAKIVRCIGDPYKRFEEDKLRMIRAVRFAADLDFKLERDTEEAIRSMVYDIKQISSERIRDELNRILLGSSPHTGIRKLHEIGLLMEILPEVAEMDGVPQPEKFHPEGDVFVHTLMMLELMKSPTLTLAYGVLLHDIGKPETIEFKDRIRFNNHDKVGALISEEICKRLRLSNSDKKKIVELVKNHQRFMHVRRMKQSTLKRFLSMDNFLEHLELHRLDCMASHEKLENYQFLENLIENLPPEEMKPEPLITGHDLIKLGYLPGPGFTEILNFIEEEQLEGKVLTKENAIKLIINKFRKRQL